MKPASPAQVIVPPPTTKTAGLPRPPLARSSARPRPMPRRLLRMPLAPLRRVPLAKLATAPVAKPPAVAPAAPAPQPLPAATIAVAPAENRLMLRGDFWEAAFHGQSALIEDCRGLRYIALLIRDTSDGRGPLHAKELVARASGQATAPIELDARDALLDPLAETQLIKRIEEIGFERTRADAARNFNRVAELEEEYERLADALAGGAGRGRRRAAFNSDAEKARKAVGKAITEAIARIKTQPALVPLATHLSGAIRKGQWLSYADHLPWQIDFCPPLPRK